MKKQLLTLGATTLLGIGTILASPIGKAEAENSKNNQDQQSDISKEISQKNAEILQVQDEMIRLAEQIKRLEQAIIDNNNKIMETETKVKETEASIALLHQEVTNINGKIEKRNEIIKRRAQSLQASGGKESYFDVLLGSENFSDFVGRLGAVATMVQADQDLVKQHEADRTAVQQKQSEVALKLSELKVIKTELEGMQTQILEQKDEIDTLKIELQKKEQQKLTEKAILQQQGEYQGTGNITSMATSAYLIPESSNKAINIVIHAGEKYIGNSVYVFGGGRNAYDVANGRFDCSGFVAWAFEQAGVKVGAYTEILKNTGTRVPFSEARPGDIVFFDTYKIDGHVGIYLGGGLFIGSQSKTGIAIADLTKGYYAEKFNGRVMRIIND
ncbi:C40 family peptidase [Bacillus sp. JJ1764]|uniref:C40 family peptidase n=1 Tax=Bacillus sp. JJ1764 TaxID=3122964 RepID=UPI002FFF5130